MKHLLTLLLFVSTSVIADVCSVVMNRDSFGPLVGNQSIQEALREGAFKFIQNSNCSKDDVLNLKIKFTVTDELLYDISANYCNFDKEILIDTTEYFKKLVCSYQKN